jgi:hypothetical protein
MSFRRAVPVWVVVALLVSCAGVLAQPAMFPEQIVNTTTAGLQNSSSVAMDANGDSLVFWDSYGGTPAQFDVFGRHVLINGGQPAGQFQANTPNSLDQYDSDAAAGPGNYVVVWTTESTQGTEVFAGLFDTAGPLGSQFRVNTDITGDQGNPSVARNASGDFVVTWESQPQFGGQTSIQAQSFDNLGSPVNPEFQANTTTSSFQERPDVAIAANGDVMIVWQSPTGPGGSTEALGRLYFGNGNPPTNEFRVNSNTAALPTDPKVAVNSNGDFLVVFEGRPGGTNGVFGRRVDSQGMPIGADFQINANVNVGAARPDVAAADDEFVVVWYTGVARGSIFGQRIDSGFGLSGGEFEVPYFGTQGCQLPTLDCPNFPRVAANSNGHVIVTWQHGDGSSGGIRERRVELAAAGGLTVDPAAAVSVHRSQAASGNRVIEPGETTTIRPTWKNTLEGTQTVTGTGSDLGGPAGGTYTFDDTTADYGSIAEGDSTDCDTATGNCYQITVSGSPRPATHWDSTFLETLSNGLSKTWAVHIGESFTDVPTSQLFYRAIESVLHGGITTGCTATTYCPGAQVTRAQMSLFLARGVAGRASAIPNSGTIGSNAYACGAGGTSLFTDVLPTDIFCRSVHYLATQNVTSGCSATQYCPTPNVTRLEMSAFVARAVVAPGGGAAVPLTYGPDPVTGLSYSCDPTSPNIHFTDVPASNGFCKHAHFLWAKGIITGCGATTFCPANPVTRDAMARFLTNGFGVRLYGP